MKRHFSLSLLAALALAPLASAQKAPAPQDPAPPPIIPSPAKVEPELPAKELAQAVPAAPAVPGAPAPSPARAASIPGLPDKGGILLNFQGASLTDVLNYLSEAAGFVIVQEVAPQGTVNVVSRQPLSPEEAIDLLNTVLVEKGYVAIRNGRILKIINRKDAQKRDIPVQMGSDPEQIPRKDEMVTQILPLRFGEAAKLVENIRPLLSDTATISANEGSNAILLTDTLNNIRRVAQIIRAVDTSVAGISTIHVYPLQYADAKELATVIAQLFANDTAVGGPGGNRGGGRGFGFGRGGFPGFPGGGGGGGPQGSAQSEARQAASRVVAVADEQSNSLIVSAPEETIATITDIVTRIDTSITDVTETRVFRLVHADAVETADILNTLYGGVSGTQGQNRNRNGNNNNNRGGQQGGQGGQQRGNSGPSERALLQSQVTAVGDPRTNSLLVSAARDTMMQIAEMVGRLDSTDTKKQHVYIHSLEHADADSVANVLRGMLGDQTAITNSSQSGANRLSERTSTGATMNTTTQSNSNGRR